MIGSSGLVRQFRATLARMDIALNSMAEAIAWSTGAGRLQWSNRAFDRLVGRPQIEILGTQVADLLPLERDGQPVPPEAHPVSAILRAGPGTTTHHEFRLAGRGVDLEISAAHVRLSGHEAMAVLTLRDVTERKQAEKRIQDQMRRLAALRTIDLAITASLDLRVTLNVLLDQVTALLQVDAANVLLLNPHTQMLESAAARGFRTAALQHTRLRLGEGHAGRAAHERRIVSVADLRETPGDFTRSPLLTHEGFIAYCAAALVAKGQVKGVLEIFHRAPLTPGQEWLDFLEALAGQAAIAVDNLMLFGELQRAHADLAVAYEATLQGWSRALDLRDRETEGHTLRVTEETLRLARVTGTSEDDLMHMRLGALLHDMGKIGIPDAILFKPGPLTDEEWAVMRKHPAYAYELLSPIAYLRRALDIPYCHHEKWDGTGYPRGLRGEQIPLAARIFAVVDVWDALRSDRPYRPAWADEKARDYIKEQAGKHFDPRVVEVFLTQFLTQEEG